MKTVEGIETPVYMTCTACMSVWSDALSWANANPEKVVKDPTMARSIVVLSCQVTDLAVLNDIRTAESLSKSFPDKQVYISGCLAKREDVPMPDGVGRLELMRHNGQPIDDRTLVNFARPFWVKDFEESSDDLSDGNIFRNMYPLRIGKGCPFNCTYCTIRVTRGSFEAYDINEGLITEFIEHDDVVLIADSPTPTQIKGWCKLAIDKGKPVSIRNIEPKVAVACSVEILDAARNGVLKIFHCPIQSNSKEVLTDMGRSVTATMEVIDLARSLKEMGVIIATNIIIDYKGMPNDFSEIRELYDYVSWNPLWDGRWDRTNAEERFKYYIGE